MKTEENACAILPVGFEGRSVKVECGKKKDPEVKTLSPMPQPKTSTVTHAHKPTVTVTHHMHVTEPEHKTTMTVLPQKQPHKHCYYDDWE